MREELMSVMREFYHDGIPDGVVSRDVEYAEKLRAATVVKGMRRASCMSTSRTSGCLG